PTSLVHPLDLTIIRSFKCTMGQLWNQWKIENNDVDGLSPQITVSTAFLQRIQDMYIQDARAAISTNSKLTHYQRFKTSFQFEPYLSSIKSAEHRVCISRLRMSAHNLRIETGRYNNLARNERICLLCNSGQVEDEIHFMLHCPALTPAREPLLSVMNPTFQHLSDVDKLDCLLVNTSGECARHITGMYELHGSLLLNVTCQNELLYKAGGCCN
ncbi:MAG: hypothetical protein MJA29_06695, partial [Candidatus Omnitrophica bacterium]|nr:hypothetical protein [Candidatus Omnitrophota bacterium]